MKWFLISLIVLPCVIHAQLKPAMLFSDNMVLQQNQPIHFWGKGKPGQKMSILFSNEKKEVIVHADSNWSVFFKKQKANIHPQSVIFQSAEEKIELKNVLIGDVWICSGQSNMEWSMNKEVHWKEEKSNTNQPLIRFMNPSPAGRYVYGISYTDSITRRLTKDSFYLWNSWQECDSNSIQPMSAVGYYFAKWIVQKKGIPIGLINLSIGGAPIESFIRKEAMENHSQFANKVKPGNWLTNETLPSWIKERASQNVGTISNMPGDDMGPHHAYKPAFAFQNGIELLLPMKIKGFIWYQGESNSLEKDRVDEYNDLIKLMIRDYRQQWIQPDMPFYWVQLSSIDTANYQSRFWPAFRDGQRRLLNEVQYSGMAVCSDIGFKDNVHPTNKKDVGERLARWALKNDYGLPIVPSGPLPLRAIYQSGEVRISFQYASGLKTADEKMVSGFSIDGIKDIAAKIQNNTIVISTDKKPEYIYYGWKPYSDGNLVNAEMLPTTTFKIKVD